MDIHGNHLHLEVFCKKAVVKILQNLGKTPVPGSLFMTMLKALGQEEFKWGSRYFLLYWKQYESYT